MNQESQIFKHPFLTIPFLWCRVQLREFAKKDDLYEIDRYYKSLLEHLDLLKGWVPLEELEWSYELIESTEHLGFKGFYPEEKLGPLPKHRLPLPKFDSLSEKEKKKSFLFL